MAIWKTGNGDGNYFNEDAKELVAAYIMHPDKAIHGYTGGYGFEGNPGTIRNLQADLCIE